MRNSVSSIWASENHSGKRVLNLGDWWFLLEFDLDWIVGPIRLFFVRKRQEALWED